MKKLVYTLAIALVAFSCDDDDSQDPVVIDEGAAVAAQLTEDAFNFCVDGLEDRISSDVVIDAGSGENQQIVVTDSEGNVLGLPPVFEGPEFDEAGVGVCYVYHVNYNGEISGLTGPVDGVATSTLSDLTGDDFQVSNFVVINRTDCNSNIVAAQLTEDAFNFCVDGLEDRISEDVVINAGSGSNQQIVVTDSEGNVLGLPPVFEGPEFDEAGVGICYVYHVNYEGEITGLTGPSDGISTSNINDLEGDFKVSNFVVVNREDCATSVAAAVLVAGDSAMNGEYAFDVGDGIDDNITDLIVEDAGVGEVSTFIITDDMGNILGLPPTMADFPNLDGVEAGVCYLYHINYEGDLIGLEAGSNIADLGGSFKLSNMIIVNRI